MANTGAGKSASKTQKRAALNVTGAGAAHTNGTSCGQALRRCVSIYCLENKRNGKQYIGKTRLSVARRWWKHQKDARLGAEWAISRAIRKYGAQSFKVTIIATATTEKQANTLEKKFIALRKTYKPAYGYNLTFGGDGISQAPESLLKRRYAAQLKGIARYVKENPLRPRWGYGRPLPNVRKDIKTAAVVFLYVTVGLSLRAIARRLHFFGVERRLRKAGIKLRTHAVAAKLAVKRYEKRYRAVWNSAEWKNIGRKAARARWAA